MSDFLAMLVLHEETLMKPQIFETNLEFVNTDTVNHAAPELKIDWVNTLFLTLTPVFSLILGGIYFSNHGFQPGIIGLAVALYFITGISITAGYHRLYSHRAYKASPIVKFLLLIFGAATFENSALKWCTDHRIHHNNVDHEKDPYNINKGFWWAHIGWIFFKEKNPKEVKYPKDFTNDKLLMWQHNNYMAIAIFMGLVVPTIIGHFLGSALGGFAIAGLARIVFVHHCTFFINSLCHMVGTRPYTDTNTARDSAIMAVFSYGEGYHNYHHYFPTDYRNGIKWFHYDPTKWLIKSLSYTGLATDLKKVPQKLIDQAVNEMANKK